MHPSAGDQDPEPNASGQPRLNFDILHLICNRLTAVSDVLSLALTCSMLTETAFQRRLRMSPAVYLWSGESVDSFHRFIFADEAARAPYIYGLRLPDRFDYHVGEHEPQYQIFDDHLVAILQAAVHVEYLSFPATGVSDRVFTAAADVATLRELRIDGHIYSEYMWKTLASFQSPIRSLRILNEDYGSDGLLDASSLQNHLTNFAHTLEVLEVQDLFLDISPSSITTPFTALRSLKAGSISNFDDLGVLLRLFPNLDDALVLDTLNESDSSPEWSQETHTWPRLDRVVCNTKSAFLMALQCPIWSMDITALQSHAMQQRYDLAPILRHSCPRHLRFSASFNDVLGDLDGLFPPEGTDNLTHLVMFAHFEIRHGRHRRRGKRKLKLVAWNQFRDKLFNSMKHLRLTHLRLVFHYSAHQPNPDAFLERDPVHTAGEMDLHLLATRLIDTMPTLRYIFLTTCGHTVRHGIPSRSALDAEWRSSKAWRVVRRDANRPAPECVELSRTDAERVMGEEELHLSRDGEDKVQGCRDSMTRGC